MLFKAKLKDMLLTAIQTTLLILIILYFVWTVFMHASTWIYFARYDRLFPPTDYEPPVSIIKPVFGLDQSAYDNYRSFCDQDYANDYEILFCLEDRSDPSIPVIQRTIEEHPGENIR